MLKSYLKLNASNPVTCYFHFDLIFHIILQLILLMGPGHAGRAQGVFAVILWKVSLSTCSRLKYLRIRYVRYLGAHNRKA